MALAVGLGVLMVLVRPVGAQAEAPPAANETAGPETAGLETAGLESAGHTLSHLELPSSPGGGPEGLASDPVTHTLFAAMGDSVLAINELTGRSTRFAEGIGGHLDHVAVDPALHEVFVSRADDYEGRWVLVFAEATLSKIATIPVVGSNIDAIAVDHARQSVITVGQSLDAGGRATFIDERTNEVRASTAVGGEPDAVAVDETGGTIYVANSTGDSVSIIDAGTRSVLATVPTGSVPAGVAVDTISHHVFVTNMAADTVTVIASTRNPATSEVEFVALSTIAVGGTPWGIAIDSARHTAFVASASTGRAAILDDDAVGGIGSESGSGSSSEGGDGDGSSAGDGSAVTEYAGPIASNPRQVAVDDALHTAFVASLNSLTIAVISPTVVLAPPRGCGFAWCA